MMRSPARTITLTLVSILLTALVAGFGVPPAQAAATTFEPDTPQRYIGLTAVQATAKDWRFGIEVPHGAEVFDVLLYLDAGNRQGQHAGPEFALRLYASKYRLYKYDTSDITKKRQANCHGKQEGTFPGSGDPRIYFTVPQRCLTYFLGNGKRVNRLRVNVVIRGRVDEDDAASEVNSYSPSQYSFGPWSNNVS